MRKLAIIISTVAVLWGCTEESGEPGDIYGMVTDMETAEPMRGTGVELWENYYTLLLKTVTYDDGHFEFDNLTPNSYELRVVADGYEETYYPIKVISGNTSRADMQLKKINTHMSVMISEITSLSYDTITLSGTYTCDESDYYTSYMPKEAGFILSQSSYPLADGSKVTAAFSEHYKSRGKFNTNVELSVGKWSVVAYAINDYGTKYGEIMYFEISGLPVVTTLTPTNVTAETATLNGHIEFAGEPAFTERGFLYSSSYPTPTVDDPASATTKVTVSGTSADFSANIAGLTSGTEYYVRAYATNNIGTSYGEAQTLVYADYFVLKEDAIAVQKYDISSGADWETANQLCESSALNGFTDWRLPTRGEFSILYSHAEEFNFNTTSTYWTSDKYTSDYGSTYYYYCDFYANRFYYESGSNTNRVRCVRSLN